MRTWAYDAQGRTISSTHADGVDHGTLEYQAHRTIVTDSQGRKSVYHTAVQHGVPLVTAIDGPGCASCGVSDMRYRYNTALQLTAKTPRDGPATHYEYDWAGPAD